MSKVTLFWFRRDLRLHDNAGLYYALSQNPEVLPLFIFDQDILSGLESNDLRVQFIHQTLAKLKQKLQSEGSDLLVRFDKPIKAWKKIVKEYDITSVYANHDYEPYARKRDEEVGDFLASRNIAFKTFKDQCLFEKDEILSGKGTPYTVFTPYKKKVLESLTEEYLQTYPSARFMKNFKKVSTKEPFPELSAIGFTKVDFEYPSSEFNSATLKSYAEKRNFPSLTKGTSKLGVHLRFGTRSVREAAKVAQKHSDAWMSELIWRDFFMQILWHYPRVEKWSFRPEYDRIEWRTSRTDFKKWSLGETGFPLVDAGMRELNQTGFMHNRVRMITASFLTKHLLIHWSEGERYFAKKLLDYDLASNNGNWQWAAGTGCDAAPYFRIFNPTTQIKKFDPELLYIKKWIPEYGTKKYSPPMVDHVEARERALSVFQRGLKGAKT